MPVLLIIFFLLCSNPLLANGFGGEFSERSIILNTFNKNIETDNNIKEQLLQKKLRPSIQCLTEEIKKGNIENVELLLKANIDPNGSYITDYPIYVASKHNKTEIVKLLRQYGAQLDRSFYSELFEAVKNKNHTLAEYLINEGGKVNYTDSVTNNTILYLSLKNKMYDISRLLIQKGARFDIASVRFIQKHKLQDLISKE